MKLEADQKIWLKYLDPFIPGGSGVISKIDVKQTLIEVDFKVGLKFQSWF